MVAVLAEPVTELSPLYSESRFCDADEAMSLLEGWAYFRETGRKQVRLVADGGKIQRLAIRTEGAFCPPLVDYMDLMNAIEALWPRQWDAVELYWGAGLRSIKEVARALHRRDYDVRLDMWEGTCEVMMMLTGKDQRGFVEVYREELRFKGMGA